MLSPRGAIMNCLLLAILLTLTPVLAHGATYYVAKTGRDSNTCAQAQSASTPKLTIQAGLACLSGGDTLIIKAGTYGESITNTIPSGLNNSSRTTVEAASRETVILNGSSGNGVLEIYSRSFITIEGIIFDGSNTPGHAAYIGRALDSHTPSSFITMQNCTVRNSPKNCGILAGRHQERVSCNFNFINVNCHSNGLSAPDGTQPHGIYIVGRDITLDGGSYYNNSGHGVHVFKTGVADATNNALVKNIRAYGNGSYGIGLYCGSNLRAYNNLVYGNGITIGSGGIAVRYDAIDVKIYNNTIYNNIGRGIFITSGGATIKNNIIYHNSGGSVVDQGTSPSVLSCNLTTDPWFINAAASDFALSANSPAIKAGITIEEVTRDFLGILRPEGASCDVGAFEYIGTPPTNLRVINGN
jgi:Right handed beta helix region